MSKNLGLAVKRCGDVVCAALGLIILLPAMLLIAAAIAATMGRPVLFVQTRPGRRERLFRIWKFRTMSDARDAHGNLLPDGERLTWLGRLLRKTSADELPQLWNILKGNMSLIGPRPLLLRYLPYFTQRERKRFEMRPGITGWAQVRGRNLAAWDERFRLDVWYVENWSLWLDVKIMLMTLTVVLWPTTVVTDAQTLGKDLDEERRERQGVMP